jgi:hypothetical protein
MRRASTMILMNWSEANFEHAGQSNRMEKLTAPVGVERALDLAPLLGRGKNHGPAARAAGHGLNL